MGRSQHAAQGRPLCPEYKPSCCGDGVSGRPAGGHVHPLCPGRLPQPRSRPYMQGGRDGQEDEMDRGCPVCPTAIDETVQCARFNVDVALNLVARLSPCGCGSCLTQVLSS